VHVRIDISHICSCWSALEKKKEKRSSAVGEYNNLERRTKPNFGR
jgi:hypothetical protein